MIPNTLSVFGGIDMKRVVCGFVAVLMLMSVAAMQWRPMSAFGQPAPAEARWQYGRLVLSPSGNPSVFVTGKARFIAQAPSGSVAANGNVVAANPASDRVTFGTATELNVEMLTLDALGSEGWEAYAVTVDKGVATVFMKRPN
jgi:hypothetical protein